MAGVLASIREEYGRYRALGAAAIAQLTDDDVSRASTADGNSIAALVWHVSGNLESRFTEFLTSDGEKPWRNRDGEFDARVVTRTEALARWDAGWQVLFAAVDDLTDADLGGMVIVRGQSLGVDQALMRSLAHTAYHVGQIVFLAKQWRGGAWECLSIPRGGSAAYNQAPDKERPSAHAAALTPDSRG